MMQVPDTKPVLQTEVGGEAVNLPNDQLRFLEICQQAKRRYSHGINDTVDETVRPARAKALCEAFPDARVENWIGRIASASTDSNGSLILAVSLDNAVSVGPWRHDSLALSLDTRIEPSGDLFQRASALKSGQQIRFSGRFLKGNRDCFIEQSITLAGSINKPGFSFQFSDLRSIE